MISIILPAYNEESNIEPLYIELTEQLRQLSEDYEIIFVIDGCTDSTEDKIREIIRTDSRIKLLSLIKNYGHQTSLVAGYSYCYGDAAIVMDCDLQHPPSLIPQLVQEWKKGYQVIYTSRKDEHEPNILKKFTSKNFYLFFQLITGINIKENSADFRLIDRIVIDHIKNLSEVDLFLRGIIPWFGFSETSIEYYPRERLSGKSKYDLIKRLKFAANGILSFSVVPIRLVSILGIIISMFGFIYMIYIILTSIEGNIPVSGYSSLLISVLFLGGIQLISLGVIGEYIGKIYMQTKCRPKFIIKEKVGF